MSVGVSVGNIKAMGVVSFTFDPASVGADGTSEQTVTVRGLQVGDFVAVSKPAHKSGLTSASARVSAANTLAIQLTAHGTVDDDSGTWLCFWARPEGDVSQVRE